MGNDYRGQCPQCGEWIIVRADGLLRKHKLNSDPCKGSETSPYQVYNRFTE